MVENLNSNVEKLITGTAAASINSGETTQTKINLRTGPVVAKMFLIHFARDSAFIEPPMRLVLEQVVNYATTHPDEKLLIVGHTDLTGSEEYNQSLSERRARSAYAFLTYGHSPEAALAEWNTLRMKRPRGELPSIKDGWGVREYQFMLQDLGYYIGNIDGQHGPKTQKAICNFQQDSQLPVTGAVGPKTWQSIIEMYLAGDKSWPLISLDGLVTNFDNTFSIKWLGFGEKDPVKNTRDAWRPNRRVEFLFVPGKSLPCKILKPATLNLVPVGGKSYLNIDNDKQWTVKEDFRIFYAREDTQLNSESGLWLIRPFNSKKILVKGIILLVNEEIRIPACGVKYALIAPNGEYLHTNDKNEPTPGEIPQGLKRGTPIWTKTGINGEFSYPLSTPTGIYTLEFFDPSPRLAQIIITESAVESLPPKGNIAFGPFQEEPGYTQSTTNSLFQEEPGYTRETTTLVAFNEFQEGPEFTSPGTATEAKGSNHGNVVLLKKHPPLLPEPIIEVDSNIIVVRKPYTNPARREVTLRLEGDYEENLLWKFESSTQDLTFFEERDGEEPVSLPYIRRNEELKGQGKKLYVESQPASLHNLDYKLNLTVAGYGKKRVKKHRLTAIDLTLDVNGISHAEKWSKGLFVRVQDEQFNQNRQMIIIGGIKPSDFEGNLILRQIEVDSSTNEVSGLQDGDGAKLKLFENEIPGAKQDPPISEIPINLPHIFTAPTGSIQFWAEGINHSISPRDTGLQLGIQLNEERNQWEFDGDRVAVTIGTSIKVKLKALDEYGKPYIGQFELKLPDGNVLRDSTDEEGIFEKENSPSGLYSIKFWEVDAELTLLEVLDGEDPALASGKKTGRPLEVWLSPSNSSFFVQVINLRNWLIPKINPKSAIPRFTKGNLVEPLIDGKDMMAKIYHEFDAITRDKDYNSTRDKDYIYITAWQLSPNVYLLGKNKEAGRLKTVLDSATSNNVGLHILVFDHKQNSVTNETKFCSYDLKKYFSISKRELIMDKKYRGVFGSHHQKTTVVRRKGELTSFVGGIDLTCARWDTSDHKYPNDNASYAYTLNFPWHDVHAVIKGPAAYDVEINFLERCNDLLGDFKDPDGYKNSPDPLMDGTHIVQTLRTFPHHATNGIVPAYYDFAPKGEFGLLAAYLKVLENAQEYIYIEDQYMVSNFYMDEPERMIHVAIKKAMLRAKSNNQHLNVILVTAPKSDIPGITKLFDFHQNEFVKYLRDADREAFVEIYHLENSENPNDKKGIYCHSKVCIVDDIWAIIGSCNLNRRSMTHDSEISIAVIDGEVEKGRRKFARDLRKKLWSEHLGLELEDTRLDNPLTAVNLWKEYAAEAGDHPKSPTHAVVHRCPSISLEEISISLEEIKVFLKEIGVSLEEVEKDLEKLGMEDEILKGEKSLLVWYWIVDPIGSLP
jgi:phosphatidylserine/phosphatidylglycerophosphate/cardiolipin synthase-like enzyme/outer membrane protein OmpA-like peptidoglycan-associated protein